MAGTRRRSTRSTAAAGPSSQESAAGGEPVSAPSSPHKKGKADNADSEEESRCPACKDDATQSESIDADKENWIRCDACTKWFHWRCVGEGSEHSPESLDKWYCGPCLAADPKRTITVRPPTRKSARTKKTQDYANLHAGNGAAGGLVGGERWLKLMEGKRINKDAFHRMQGSEVSLEWLESDENALKEPIIIENPEGLGMKMPPEDFTVDDVADAVGRDTPLAVIDVVTQSNCPGWTLGRWAEYYNTPAPSRDKVRNVISLEISDTPLADQVLPPRLVRELDWVEKFWPSAKRGRGHSYPKVQLYCLMGVSNAWTDWHIDFAGSSVYYHILRGAKTFYFIRPTPANLHAYERWSGTELQNHAWLGDLVDEVIKVELVTGNTMVIPTGWIHAVYTPEDTLVFGGNFLHSYNISTQLKVCEIEHATRVAQKFRFPHFTKLCWYVAEKYVRDLKAKEDFPPRVMESMEALASFLISEVHAMERGSDQAKKVAKEHVPGERIKDPAALAREFRWRVRLASGYSSDDDGHGRRKAKAQTAAVADLIVNGTPNGHSHGKRKRESPAAPPPPVATAGPSSTSRDEDDGRVHALFKNFRPKAWDLEEEVKSGDDIRTTVAPKPGEGDSWAAAWADWREDWTGTPDAVPAEVRSRRHVLVRTRRTAQGLERQRIERVLEEWVWKDEEAKAQVIGVPTSLPSATDIKEELEAPTPAPGEDEPPAEGDAMETGP